jgi:hypothetical protein
MSMPFIRTCYVVQFEADTGEWVDLEESPVKQTAEATFRDYRKKIPKAKQVRFIKRIEETLGIRV